MAARAAVSGCTRHRLQSLFGSVRSSNHHLRSFCCGVQDTPFKPPRRTAEDGILETWAREEEDGMLPNLEQYWDWGKLGTDIIIAKDEKNVRDGKLGTDILNLNLDGKLKNVRALEEEDGQRGADILPLNLKHYPRKLVAPPPHPDDKLYVAPPDRPSPRKYYAARHSRPPGLKALDPAVRATVVCEYVPNKPWNAKSLTMFIPREDTNCRVYFTAHSIEDDGTLTSIYHKYPPSPIHENWIFSGAYCSDGLFHFENKTSRRQHYLWDAKTNEAKIIPDSFARPPNVIKNICDYAMWSDNLTGDIKLLQCSMVEDASHVWDNIYDATFQLELYSLKTNSWSIIPLAGEGYYYIASKNGACVNGTFYCPVKEEKTQVLLTFNFSTQRVSTLALPPAVTRLDVFTMFEYNGCLSLVSYSAAHAAPCSYDYWFLEDEVWVHIGRFSTFGVQKPVWGSNNGRLLYFESLNDELVVFDIDAWKLKRLGIYCYSLPMWLFPVHHTSGVVSDDVEEVEKGEADYFPMSYD